MVKLFDSLTAGLPSFCYRLLLFTAFLPATLALPLDSKDLQFSAQESENITALHSLSKRDVPDTRPLTNFPTIKVHKSRGANDAHVKFWNGYMTVVKDMVCFFAGRKSSFDFSWLMQPHKSERKGRAGN